MGVGEGCWVGVVNGALVVALDLDGASVGKSVGRCVVAAVTATVGEAEGLDVGELVG